MLTIKRPHLDIPESMNFLYCNLVMMKNIPVNVITLTNWPLNIVHPKQM